MKEEEMPVRILVIDDDTAVRLSLAVLLGAKGYEVVVAADGAEGFAQYVKHQPDIVMSDMIMPGQEALETIAKIRQLSPDVPIIAMSGSVVGGPASFLERAQKAGANLCLEKPFETDQILDALAGLLKD
jgi:two-component system KDP operon response regulator KdpE